MFNTKEKISLHLLQNQTADLKKQYCLAEKTKADKEFKILELDDNLKLIDLLLSKKNKSTLLNIDQNILNIIITNLYNKELFYSYNKKNKRLDLNLDKLLAFIDKLRDILLLYNFVFSYFDKNNLYNYKEDNIKIKNKLTALLEEYYLLADISFYNKFIKYIDELNTHYKFLDNKTESNQENDFFSRKIFNIDNLTEDYIQKILKTSNLFIYNGEVSDYVFNDSVFVELEEAILADEEFSAQIRTLEFDNILKFFQNINIQNNKKKISFRLNLLKLLNLRIYYFPVIIKNIDKNIDEEDPEFLWSGHIILESIKDILPVLSFINREKIYSDLLLADEYDALGLLDEIYFLIKLNIISLSKNIELRNKLLSFFDDLYNIYEMYKSSYKFSFNKSDLRSLRSRLE